MGITPELLDKARAAASQDIWTLTSAASASLLPRVHGDHRRVASRSVSMSWAGITSVRMPSLVSAK